MMSSSEALRRRALLELRAVVAIGDKECRLGVHQEVQDQRASDALIGKVRRRDRKRDRRMTGRRRQGEHDGMLRLGPAQHVADDEADDDEAHHREQRAFADQRRDRRERTDDQRHRRGHQQDRSDAGDRARDRRRDRRPPSTNDDPECERHDHRLEHDRRQ
jgi:hypothetical protein